MKKKLYVFYSLFFFCTIFSQQLQLTGKVITLKNDPVEFAEVKIISKDSIALKSYLTNSSGEFSLQIPRGFYTIQIKKLKSTLYTKNVELKENISLGEIKIDNTTDIKGVSISGKKKLIERKVDRLIFNVENSISSTGGDALDVLKVTPGIQVQSGQVYMIGKNSLLVMIDDRPMQLAGSDLINHLKTIRSDDISSVEIISNPSAKYDAEGKSGIINIKLKKIKKDSWNASVRSTYEQHTYATGVWGGNFNYQKNKLSILSSISYTNGSLRPKETERIDYPKNNWNSNSLTRNYDDLITGKIGIDYNVSKKFTFGVQYLGGSSAPDIRQENVSTLSKPSGGLSSDLSTKLYNKKNNQNHLLNVHAFYTIDTLGRKLSFNIDYFNFKKKNNLLFSTQTTDYESNTQDIVAKNNFGEQNIENYSIKIDMDHPFTSFSLSYGGKLSFTRTNNDLSFFDVTTGEPIYDINQSNKFRYKDNIQALYVQGSKKFGKDKWEIQAGLRMENTQTDGTSITTNERTKLNYIEFFPSVFIAYNPGENHSFSLDYGRRINRPRYNLLNPFKVYSSSYAYTTGNPFLLPSFSHNITFNHTYKGVLNSSLYYSRENRGYSMLTFINEGAINQVTSPTNYYTSNQFGLNESYTFNKFSFWESYIAVNISYSRTISDNPYTERLVEGFGGDISLSNSFILNKSKTFMGGLDLSYSFPTTFLNIKNKSVFNLDLSLKYLLMKKKLQLGLVVTDLFATNKQRWETLNNGINIYRTNYEDVRGIRISAAYRFGSNKIKVKEVKTGSAEEFGRAKGD